MAEQWEATFRTMAEATHAITEIIINANEGDDLEQGYKVSDDLVKPLFPALPN